MRIPRPCKAPEEIDALVCGAGISGLLTAAFLLKKGRRVHLTEKTAQPGGRLSPESRAGFLLGAGFAFGEASWWRAAADRLGIASPTLPVAEGGALAHGARGWSKPAEDDLPLWERTLSEPCSEFPVAGAFGIAETLLSFCGGFDGFSLGLEAPVTALVGKGGRIATAALGKGGEHKVNEVYWSAPYSQLLEVLGGDVPAPGPERVSWLKRFHKSPAQPGVVLELAHGHKLGEFTETLLLPLPGLEKDEKRFVVGAITSNRDPSLAPEGKSLSTWIFPLTEAEWGDNHETMKKIRAARRLIEKAFPNPAVAFDRVLVLEATLSPLAKKKGEWEAPLGNLQLTADWAMPSGATLASVADALLKTL